METFVPKVKYVIPWPKKISLCNLFHFLEIAVLKVFLKILPLHNSILYTKSIRSFSSIPHLFVKIYVVTIGHPYWKYQNFLSYSLRLHSCPVYHFKELSTRPKLVIHIVFAATATYLFVLSVS